MENGSKSARGRKVNADGVKNGEVTRIGERLWEGVQRPFAGWLKLYRVMILWGFSDLMVDRLWKTAGFRIELDVK